MTERRAKLIMGPAARWARAFHGRARGCYVMSRDRNRDDDAHQAARDAGAVAGTLIGMVDREARQEVYDALCLLLLRGDRFGDWRAALAAIPAEPVRIRALGTLIRRYDRAALDGHFESFATAVGVRLRDVVPVMCRVAPFGEAFVAAAAGRWFRHPNRVFSEETLVELRPRLRGVLGAFADQHDDHGAQIREFVRVVD